MVLLYADDLVVIAETENDLIKRLNEWRIMWRIEASATFPASCAAA